MEGFGNSSNSTCTMFNVDYLECSTLEKAIAFLIWILVAFFGNALIMGMMFYERLQGDPLKRRITDQVCMKEINNSD